MLNSKKIALSLIIGLTAIDAVGQISSTREPRSGRVNSPYSRFGIGNLGNNYSPGLRGMGGIANGYAKEYTINAYNPASYTYLNRMVFEFAFDAQSNNVKIDDDITKSSTISIGQFNLALPIVKSKLAVNLGYMPYSKVYYNANDSVNVGGLGRAVKNFNGEGGINYGYFGIAGGTSGFSIGVNAGYLFGNIRNSTYFNVVDSNAIFSRVTDYSSTDIYSGLLVKGGLMYKKRYKNDNYFSVGATGTFSQKINITRNDYEVAGTVPLSPNDAVVTDTISANYDKKGKMQLPSEFGFGVHFGNSYKYDLGIDFTYSNWSQFKKFDETQLGVGDRSYRLAIGGEILPNASPTNKQYLTGIIYRLGGYYGQDYIKVNGNNVNYYGLTFGMQLPMRNTYRSDQAGSINLSFDIGNRGKIESNLSREFYVKFTAALRLSDIWFQRDSYD